MNDKESSGAERITVLIADDHMLLREGIAAVRRRSRRSWPNTRPMRHYPIVSLESSHVLPPVTPR
jgi:hypothetical protein